MPRAIAPLNGIPEENDCIKKIKLVNVSKKKEDSDASFVKIKIVSEN